MDQNIIVEKCLASLRKEGAQKAQVVLTETTRTGLAVENRRIFLLRNSSDVKLDLVSIASDRYASLSINSIEPDETALAVRQVLENTKKAPQDPAHDISPFQPPEKFDNGVVEPDMELLYGRFEDFLSDSERYQTLTFRRMTRLEFFSEKKTFLNSNGASFFSRIGYYEFNLIFSSREQQKNSLGYFTTIRAKDLDRPLIEWGGLKTLFRQSAESINTSSAGGNFCGEIIVSPECLGELLDFVTENALRDAMLISGTSVYKDSIGKNIAVANLSLSSLPLSSEIAAGYFITSGGDKAANLPIIKDGVLQTFILSPYGVRKTGFAGVSNSGGCYSVAAGKMSSEALIKSVKKGLLVTRFSGGKPNQRGDFSGVVKNSFYIEDGKIKFPVSETMISGNIPQMLLSIKGISKERINFGNAIYPWILFGGITISGK